MSNKIYVGNLAYSVMEDRLRETFIAFGSVESCKIITDRDTGRNKGFAFVEMDSIQSAQDAILGLNGSDLDGRAMIVNEAKPQERRDNYQRASRW